MGVLEGQMPVPLAVEWIFIAVMFTAGCAIWAAFFLEVAEARRKERSELKQKVATLERELSDVRRRVQRVESLQSIR